MLWCTIECPWEFDGKIKMKKSIVFRDYQKNRVVKSEAETEKLVARLTELAT